MPSRNDRFMTLGLSSGYGGSAELGTSAQDSWLKFRVCGVTLSQEIFAGAVILSESSDRITYGEFGGRSMTTISTDGTWLSREIRSRVCSGDNIRALIADQLGVDIKRVSDQAHFARDLGVGWLNRLELVIFVEDWTGLELHDDEVEQINVVGDLICLFESAKEQSDRLN
jgi:acyl carrier protein